MPEMPDLLTHKRISGADAEGRRPPGTTFSSIIAEPIFSPLNELVLVPVGFRFIARRTTTREVVKIVGPASCNRGQVINLDRFNSNRQLAEIAFPTLLFEQGLSVLQVLINIPDAFE